MKIKIEDKNNTPLDPKSIRKIESQHYHSRDFDSSVESGDENTYEWFEDEVIKKNASVELGLDAMGLESATIKVLIEYPDLTTTKKEVVYYTTDQEEIARIKTILEGKTIIVDER